ncbi:hypothetical protein [Pseudomonas syringae]|uniref:hypothetical protein n=1 Tax=Pseudomonas syringae TaxID=317 RepID=UPI001F1911FF|nr:hypothetical protein [Pseudomonas syringae]MCF5371355.1 hypothetical protein [Pseudomonas syringae]
MNAINTGSFYLVVAAALALSAAAYQDHSTGADTLIAPEQDGRCSLQASAPYVPFKDLLDCLTWKRKTDVPMPAQG